jgi:hypothetical protein
MLAEYDQDGKMIATKYPEPSCLEPGGWVYRGVERLLSAGITAAYWLSEAPPSLKRCSHRRD